MFSLADLEIAEGQRVVKAAQVEELISLQSTIDNARQQAEQIVADAQKKYAKEKKRGYEEGLAEGKMDIAEKMIDAVAKSVEYFSSLESKIVDITSKAVRKIIGEMDGGERIVAIVREALSRVRTQDHVTVRISSESIESVKKRIDEILSEYPTIHFLDVEEDTRLEAGGCIIETAIGVVNASLELQLTAIENALSRSLKQRGT